MNVHVKCNDCAADLVLSPTECREWLGRHLSRCPDHGVHVSAVAESPAESRIGVAEGRLDQLERLVDLLLAGGLTRGDFSVNRVRDIKFGPAAEDFRSRT